jgi:NAD(P)-dependent dehydrogenase (short-subunit alcohol dehydrogenase family)
LERRGADELTKVGLVTGGTRGIGFGIASSLTRAGFDLALCGVRNEDQVRQAIESLTTHGRKVVYYQADVSKPEAREQLIQNLRSDFGSLNLLVNNAGVAPKQRMDVLEATEESFDWVFTVNMKGPYFLTQLVANWIIEQKNSHPDLDAAIINISSISATVASVSRGEYCISKAAIAMATQLWAVRLSEFGIPVFEVRPGLIATDMTAAVKDKYDQLIKEGLIPQARWGTPEDVGKAVAALATGCLSYSTGQVVMVDGGMTLAQL